MILGSSMDSPTKSSVHGQVNAFTQCTILDQEPVN